MLLREIIGQDKAVTTLRQALENDRLAHAYLFVGPQGVGKRLTAFTLAQAIFCLHREEEACNSCQSCLKVINNCHPNLYFIDSEENAIKIDQIRLLQKQLFLRGVEGEKKVAIINGVEKLTPEAANAFLKTLEEPPSGAVIILLTSQPTALLPTVISRCQLLRFFSLPAERLANIMTERLGFSVKDASLITSLTEDGMGQILNLSRSSIGEKMDRVERLLAVVDTDSVFDLFNFSKDESEDRAEVEEILRILEALSRRVLLNKYGYLKDSLEGKIYPVGSFFSNLSRQSCLEAIDIIRNTKATLARNGHTRLALEVMVLEFRRLRKKSTH